MKKFFLFWFLLFPAVHAMAADIPVLLRLSRTDQADTNGCNFVEQLTAIIYREIVDGRVKLWDSPAKEIQITGITLQELEKSTDTKFAGQEYVFIYELWQSNRKVLTSATLGFNFSNKTGSGEDVAYGFVEYSAVRDLFLRTRISTNANGDYSSTYASYINNKNYNYNIIQFNGKVVKDGGESARIKREFIAGQQFNPATFVFSDPDRLISWQVEKSTQTDEKSINSNRLLEGIESYLTENEEIFYNFGGDKILSYFQKNQLHVTKVECNEIWKKISDSIFTETKSMTIYVNDSALFPMNAKEISRLEVMINGKHISDFIRQKRFNIVITQINAQKVSRKDAFLYYKGLMSSEWRNLTAYVKNY